MPKVPFRAVALFAASVVIVAGCFLTEPSAQTTVKDLELAFPTVNQLAVTDYYDYGDGCVFFEYRRGSFSSLPDSGWCDNAFSSDPPVAFDPQALDDLSALKAEFRRDGLALTDIRAGFHTHGSLDPGSSFSTDTLCMDYVWHPGWTKLPETDPGNSMSMAVNADWYETNICP